MKKEKNKEQSVKKKQESKQLIKTKGTKPSKLKWIGNIFGILILVVIIIAIYILLNWGAEKLNISDIDLTTDKIYSITQPTIDKLKNLDQDVTINLVNMSMYTSLTDLADKYANLNEHIKVTQVDDISTRPDWQSTYGLSADSEVLIFESGDKDKVVEISDLSTYDSSTYATIDKTEEVITNAILNVTVVEKPKIYFLTGHNNYSDTSLTTLQTALEDEANEVESLNIMTNTKMPEDCDLLVITTLAEDLKDLERDEIITYIHNGGKILLLVDPNTQNLELPNFQKILDEYGITIGNGIVIETDDDRMISGAPNFIISGVSTDSAITKDIGMNINTCFINSGKIDFAQSEEMEELGVEVEYLTAAGPDSFYRTDLTITSQTKTDSDEDMTSYTTGAILTKKIDDNTSSKIVVFSNCVFATDTKIQLTNQYYIYAIDLYNNEDTLLNSVSYLTEKEDSITIRKNVESVTYTVTAKQNKVILIIIFAVPIAIIFIGILVWQIRRRKK